MQSLAAASVLAVIASLSCYSSARASTAEADAEKDRPNIIFLLIDDQGWTDLSSRMDENIEDSTSDYYETPNIDRLARQSVRFANGYSPSPICAPSRASYLTGKSPQQLRMTDIPESRPGSRRFTDLYAGKRLIPPQPLYGLPDEEITIAEIIRDRVDADYATAHFGKWHLAGGGPGRHGFDIHDGSTGNHNVAAHSEDPNPKDVFGVTGRAIAFMKSQVHSKRPFFLQLSHYANHVPLAALNETIEKYKSKPKGERHTNPVYAALNENLDSSVGSLLDALEELGIRDNTYIFYTSDNGGSKNIKNPSTNNLPLREGKTWVYEGGIRVPFMISGPGLEPGRSDIPVIGWDFYPTFCAILQCRGALPNGIEGGNLMPMLRGEDSTVERRHGNALVWHFPHYLTAKGSSPQSAIRVGDFKLIRFYHDQQSELFDLKNDIGETIDVAAQYPDLAARLEKQLSAYLSDIGAAMPIDNTPRTSPANIDPSLIPSPTEVSFDTRHTSVFSKISYRIPKGWVVIDGESDWIASSMDKQFWEPGFNPEVDSYFAVSGLPHYLSLDDKQSNRVRTLAEIALETLHSLEIAKGATVTEPPVALELGGKDAIAFVVAFDDQLLYQVFVSYEEGKVATVAGHGPNSQLASIKPIVAGIASTISASP